MLQFIQVFAVLLRKTFVNFQLMTSWLWSSESSICDCDPEANLFENLWKHSGYRKREWSRYEYLL